MNKMWYEEIDKPADENSFAAGYAKGYVKGLADRYTEFYEVEYTKALSKGFTKGYERADSEGYEETDAETYAESFARDYSDSYFITKHEIIMRVLAEICVRGMPFEAAAEILHLNENEREHYSAVFADMQNQ